LKRTEIARGNPQKQVKIIQFLGKLKIIYTVTAAAAPASTSALFTNVSEWIREIAKRKGKLTRV
jgi:hypothetical protein